MRRPWNKQDAQLAVAERERRRIERAALEVISDKIRRGEPVPLMDAIAAINYQEWLKQQRQQTPTMWQKIIRFFLPND